MKDERGREIDYIRVSITDRCNLRCKYCMPEGIQWFPMSEILTYEEIEAICREAASLGIKKIKITGGEPLVRKGCIDLIVMLKRIHGIEQVTLTTNGVLLAEHLSGLKEAGVDGINISLDTLDAEKYQEITGFAGVEKVLEALKMSAESGIPTKVNAVLQKGRNEEEWYSLIQIAKKYPVDVRFIELMPIGEGRSNLGISNIELQKQMKGNGLFFEEDLAKHGNGPAVYVKIPGYQGSIGFISAMHGKFCDSCNRIRLTATGELKPCLCYGDSYSVKEAVRNGNGEDIRKVLQTAILRKPGAHCFENRTNVTEEHKMAQIGG